MKQMKACMLANYSVAKDKSKDDLILVKERIRNTDGSESSDIELIYNPPKSFYVTKPAHRQTHTTKKEYELLENLIEYNKSTQAKMAQEIANALNMRMGYPDMRELRKSPYLYGTDISVTSLKKQEYMEKYPDYMPEAYVAALDTETNVFTERGEIIYAAVTFKDKAVLAVNSEWLGNIPKADAQLQELFTRYLGQYKKERNIKLYVRIVENDLEVVKKIFQFLHKYKPDLVSIWNMSFDVEKIIDCCKHHGVDPAEVFCDPAVPKRFRRYDWRKDDPQKTTSTGKVTSKHYADLWHVLDAPSSFYIIDSMCFFKINRVREQARHSYSLDNILSEELEGLTKLKFKEAEHLSGLEWHQFMQRNYKLEYGIYNLFDCISLELLDEKTGDLRKAVMAGVGITDLKNLTSGPKNLANDLHVFLKKQGKIICSTSPDMTEELDEKTIGMENWILARCYAI